MKITYQRSDWNTWTTYDELLGKMILKDGAIRICEIGGGANPTLSLDFVREHSLEYTLMDISELELSKAPDGYRKVCADITGEVLPAEEGRYDLFFSKMLAEHVSDGLKFHSNVHRLLAPNGKAFHFFPTLFAPPFVFNFLLPEILSELILRLVQDGRKKDGKFGKFPAKYSLCRGPIPRQIKIFNDLGYQVEEYTGFFGHSGYYAKLPMLRRIHERLVAFLLRHPTPWLTSYAFVLLSKKN